MAEEIQDQPVAEPEPTLEDEVGEEFEEITSDEVDRVVGLLEELMLSVESENINSLLEEAATSIYELVYDESDEVEQEDEPMAEAA